jgi:tRNA nucleotidyltransferase/poly(A) polymerase
LGSNRKYIDKGKAMVMKKSFYEFLILKETNGEKPVSSEVKLSDDSEFKPFIVDQEHHPNLKVIVQAFLSSDKVALPGPEGYPQKLTTIDPGKGETTPKLKKKNLYLVGGAVRDHLAGKTPKDYDLATDATPDEIRLILRNAGFTETKPQTGKHAPVDKKYEKHPEAGSKSRIFYAKGWDRAGREFVMGARVNGEEFEIATFRRDSKSSDGRTPDRMEFSGLSDDAQRRDFTINALYIPLTSADGPNAKLIDPHGGVHHLKKGEVHFIGNPKDRLEEDQLRAMRYLRHIATYGKNTKISDEVKQTIADIKDLPAVSRERIREEFVKGLEHPEVDPRQYIKLYKDIGLLDTVFPGMNFKLDEPRDFSEKKDRRLAVAWILRNNNPEDIQRMLAHGTWTTDEIRDIIHLIDINGWLGKYNRNRDQFYNDYYDLRKKMKTTRLVPSLVRQWGQMNNHPADVLNHYLDDKLFSTNAYIPDEFGQRKIDPTLISIHGGTPVGPEMGDAIKQRETLKFRQRLEKPKS